MLREKAEEFGIDLDADSDEEFAEMRQRRDEKIESEDLTKLTNRYVEEAQTLLDDKDEWLIFSLPDEEIQQELLSVIQWHHFFTAAKIHRGLFGIIDTDGNLDEEELSDSQSDANGSIKIALIAVERSMRAWTALMSAENASQIKPLLHLLETVKKKAEEKFPAAREFIRPGFDEVETVM